MSVEHIQTIILQLDNIIQSYNVMFNETDFGNEYEIECTAKLVGMRDGVVNGYHNKTDYVFDNVNIKKIKEE